jgi:hypothetical protein
MHFTTIVFRFTDIIFFKYLYSQSIDTKLADVITDGNNDICIHLFSNSPDGSKDLDGLKRRRRRRREEKTYMYTEKRRRQDKGSRIEGERQEKER